MWWIKSEADKNINYELTSDGVLAKVDNDTYLLRNRNYTITSYPNVIKLELDKKEDCDYILRFRIKDHTIEQLSHRITNNTVLSVIKAPNVLKNINNLIFFDDYGEPCYSYINNTLGFAEVFVRLRPWQRELYICYGKPLDNIYNSEKAFLYYVPLFKRGFWRAWYLFTHPLNLNPRCIHITYEMGGFTIYTMCRSSYIGEICPFPLPKNIQILSYLNSYGMNDLHYVCVVFDADFKEPYYVGRQLRWKIDYKSTMWISSHYPYWRGVPSGSALVAMSKVKNITNYINCPEVPHNTNRYVDFRISIYDDRCYLSIDKSKEYVKKYDKRILEGVSNAYYVIDDFYGAWGPGRVSRKLTAILPAYEFEVKAFE